MRLIDANKIGLTDFEILMCNGNYKEGLEMILQKIEDAPTIDAVPVVHGEWRPGKEISRTMLGDETLAIEYDAFYCSSCGRRYKEYVLVYNYCPQCGADMRETDGEEARRLKKQLALNELGRPYDLPNREV